MKGKKMKPAKARILFFVDWMLGLKSIGQETCGGIQQKTYVPKEMNGAFASPSLLKRIFLISQGSTARKAQATSC